MLNMFNALLEWNAYIDPKWLAWNEREIGNNMKMKYKIEIERAKKICEEMEERTVECSMFDGERWISAR